MQNTIISIFKEQATAGAFKSDTGAVLKQISKGGDFLATLLEQITTKEQAQALCKNQKAVKRFLQACNFSLSGDVSNFEPYYAYVFATIALTKSDSISFDSMRFILGLNKEGAQNVSGVSRARLDKFLKLVSNPNTVKTKVTHSVGTNGFMTALGVTTKSDAHGFTLTASAKNHPLVLGYAYQLERMTDGQFALISEKQANK